MYLERCELIRTMFNDIELERFYELFDATLYNDGINNMLNMLFNLSEDFLISCYHNILVACLKNKGCDVECITK